MPGDLSLPGASNKAKMTKKDDMYLTKDLEANFPSSLLLAIGQMYNCRTIESGRPVAPKSLAEEFYKYSYL